MRSRKLTSDERRVPILDVITKEYLPTSVQTHTADPYTLAQTALSLSLSLSFPYPFPCMSMQNAPKNDKGAALAHNKGTTHLPVRPVHFLATLHTVGFQFCEPLWNGRAQGRGW